MLESPKGEAVENSGFANVVLPAPSVSGTMRSRMSFAIQHMLAAARFSRQCAGVERAHIGKNIDYFFDEIMHSCNAAVLLAVASLEANINEVFFDKDLHFLEQSPDLLKEMWRLLARKSILEKYQAVMVLKGVEKLDQSKPPYQDVEALIQARNALVHFKPEWDDEQKALKDVATKLEGKFPFSPFMDSGAPKFPHRCMGHGFSSWAVRCSLHFMEVFHQSADIPHKFSIYVGGLDPA